MCDPVSIGLVAGQTLLQFQGERQAAKASEKAARQAALNANRAFGIEAAAENDRLVEEAARDSDAILDNQRKALQAQATARVAAGEAGVAGLSIDALLGDFQRDEAVFRNRTAQNAEARERQSRRRLQGADATRQSRINDANSRVQARPSFLGAALRIGASGVQAYNADQAKNQE